MYENKDLKFIVLLDNVYHLDRTCVRLTLMNLLNFTCLILRRYSVICKRSTNSWYFPPTPNKKSLFRRRRWILKPQRIHSFSKLYDRFELIPSTDRVRDLFSGVYVVLWNVLFIYSRTHYICLCVSVVLLGLSSEVYADADACIVTGYIGKHQRRSQ